MKTVAIIPVYNHGETVGDVVATLRGYGLPVILVDDGSDEATARALDKIATRAKAFGPSVKLIRFPKNRGKGAAVMTGLRRAHDLGATHALQVDADGQHGLEVVPRFLDAATEQPEAVIAGRPLYDATVPRTRFYARYFTHVWVWINTLSTRIVDSMCGFRLYPLDAVMKVLPAMRNARRMDFDTEIAVRLDWEGVPFVNLPVAVRYPLGGRSHFRVGLDNLRISVMHAKLFFGMLRRLPKLIARHKKQDTHHWAQIGEASFLGGMRLMFWIYRHGGVWIFRGCLFFVIAWYFLIRGAARRASLEYLSRLHEASQGATPPSTLRNAFRHFMQFGESILDKLLAMDMQEKIQEPYSDEGLDAFHDLVDEGQGVLVIAAHFGNLELLRRLGRNHRGHVRMTLLAHTRHAKRFYQLLCSLNPAHEFDVVQVDSIDVSTAMMLSERISAGGVVIITGDRVPPIASGNTTLPVSFLGKEAHFPVGPYILGAALGCPVWMMFSARDRKGFSVTAMPLADRIVLPRRNRQAAIHPHIETYVAALAKECKKHPFQWFNFFPFWQAPADRKPAENDENAKKSLA